MSDGEKKYEPTLKRRETARREGRFAYSPDLSGAFAFAVGLTGVLVCAASVYKFIEQRLLESLQVSADGSQTLTVDLLFQAGWGYLGQLFYLILPFIGLLFASSLAVHFSQRRFVFAPDREWADAKNVNPSEGFTKLFSSQNWARQTVNLFKAALIFLLVWLFFRSQFTAIVQLSYGELNAAALQSGELLKTVLIRLAALLLVVGAADYFWQYRRFENSLWMTEQEMRDEQKND